MAKRKKAARKLGETHRRHRDRHRPSGFQFLLADSIRFVPPEPWDSVLTDASIFMSRRYLEALELAPPPRLQPRYALVFRHEKPVAAVSAQLLTISASQLYKDGDDSEVGAPSAEGASAERPAPASTDALKKITERVTVRTLVCGNLLSWGTHGVAFRRGERPDDVWPGVAEALYRIRRADRLSGQTDLILVKDLHDDTEVGIDALKRFSYRPLETEPNMLLTLPADCHTFDDYLGALNARYRKAARKVFRQIDAAGLTVEELGDVHRHTDAVHGLYEQVRAEASVRLVSLAPEYLGRLSQALGGDFRCTVVRDADRLHGFVTTLRDDEDTAVAYYIGYDRAANESAPVYLRLLYATVEDAMRLGCRRVSFGRTALEPKSRLGAEPVPFRCWLRHRLPFVNFVVRKLLRVVPHAEAPERSPFKAK